MQPGSIAVVVKGYPRLSESFIAQELAALERRGLSLRIVSLRQPTDPHAHSIHRQIVAPVSYLPEYLWREPRRVWSGWRRARRLAGYTAAVRAWLGDLARDRTPNRIRRFGQALVLAAELPDEVRHVHAHFLHTPSSVARYAASMRGLAWSASAHAKDIWTTPDWEKREKLASAAWVVTCTADGQRHLQALAPAGSSVDRVYHGLDERRFPTWQGERPATEGGDPTHPARLLAVGRAVPKKGLGDLLEALARLPADLDWRLTHIGGGPLLRALRRQAERLGLAARIDWLGPQPQAVVLDHYRASDLFVLASRIADDGDRDGLPNVLVEALSQACPVLATRVAAIPELIDDDVTGAMVEPGDAAALAAAMARLIRDPALRRRLALSGQARVRADFAMERGIDHIAARLRALLAAAQSPANAEPKPSPETLHPACASPSMRR